MGEPWQARLSLVEGHVVACYVHSQVDGRRLLSGDEALRWLAHWGQRELAWTLKVFTPHQTVPHPAPAGPLPPERNVAPPQRVSQPGDLPTPAGLILPATQVTPPQRIEQAEQGVISSWPRKHRQIFALVDGKRSVGHIAAILKQSPEVVEGIVNELQSLGVIRR
jgi:hypothetical protein